MLEIKPVSLRKMILRKRCSNRSGSFYQTHRSRTCWPVCDLNHAAMTMKTLRIGWRILPGFHRSKKKSILDHQKHVGWSLEREVILQATLELLKKAHLHGRGIRKRPHQIQRRTN